MGHFNEMNDDCLLQIFDYFSLRELILYRLVCRRWESALELAGRTRTSLKLFGSIGDIHYYCLSLMKYSLENVPYYVLGAKLKHDELIAKDAKTAATNQCRGEFLAHLFPNITTLIVRWSSNTRIDLSYLLSAWTKQLVNVSLFEIPHCHELQREILSSIASMSKLKRLDLFNTFRREFHSLQTYQIILDHFPVNVLSQLEHLSLGVCFSRTHLHLIVSKLGSALMCLALHGISIKLEDLRLFYSINPVVATKLTHLTIDPLYNKGVSQEMVQYIGDMFCSLKSLTFSPLRYDTFFISLLKPLAQLKSLTSLNVIYFTDYRKNACVQYYHQFSEVDLNLNFKLSSLAHLRVKNSKFLVNYPTTICETLPNVLPNLKHLEFVERCCKTEFLKMKPKFDEDLCENFSMLDSSSISFSSLGFIPDKNLLGTHHDPFYFINGNFAEKCFFVLCNRKLN